MIVAMAIVGVMQTPIDDVVSVIAMRNCLVAAARTMDVVIFMYDRIALVGICCIDFQTMLIIVVAVFVVHMTVMQVVGVIPMFDLGVTAVLTVHMVMIFMHLTFFASHHLLLQFYCHTVSVYARNSDLLPASYGLAREPW